MEAFTRTAYSSNRSSTRSTTRIRPLLLLTCWYSVLLIGMSQDGSLPILFVAHAFSSHQPIVAPRSPLLRCEKNTGRKTVKSVVRLFSSSSTKTTTHQDTEGDHHMQSFPTGGIQVWDGVFSQEVCKELHELAIDHSERTTGEEEDDYCDDDENEDDDEEEDDSLDGSSIFIHKRNGSSREKNYRLTPLEQALGSFLTAYYDNNNDDSNTSKDMVVEYWCRQEHLNLEAHADVDEVFFERYCNNNNNNNNNNNKSDSSSSSSRDDNSGFRYPTTGHILYLTKPTLGLGPTCVFPPDNASSNGTDDTNSRITESISSVVTIPAVPGRVLRFPGNALHAVPKPADVWFSNDDDDHEEEEEEDADEDDDEDWDDEDEDDEERSVILFNTWEQTDDNDDNDDLNNVGPIGVMHDPMFTVESDLDIVDMMMSSVDISAEDSGVEIDEDFVQSMVRYAKEQKAKQLRDWRDKYSEGNNIDNSNHNEEEDEVVYSKLHCQPRSSWAITPIDTTTTEQDAVSESKSKDTSTIRVPLMGDKIRRRYPQKAVRWNVPSNFQQGANDPKQPFVFPLKTK
jgi:hypothetical protein